MCRFDVTTDSRTHKSQKSPPWSNVMFNWPKIHLNITPKSLVSSPLALEYQAQNVKTTAWFSTCLQHFTLNKPQQTNGPWCPKDISSSSGVACITASVSIFQHIVALARKYQARNARTTAWLSTYLQYFTLNKPQQTNGPWCPKDISTNSKVACITVSVSIFQNIQDFKPCRTLRAT